MGAGRTVASESSLQRTDLLVAADPGLRHSAVKKTYTSGHDVSQGTSLSDLAFCMVNVRLYVCLVSKERL